MNFFRKKSKIERLKDRYRQLMKKSYETALRDTEKSERVQNQAQKLFQEIQYLSLRQGDK